MRIAILSDIHGNLEALLAVLKDCARQKIDCVLSAGDIVGYGANPRECIDILRKVCSAGVAGNHDMAAIGKLDATYFTDDGRKAIEWTRNVLSFDDIEYLSGLNLTYQNEHLDLVHSGLFEPLRFHYLDDVIKAAQSFTLLKSAVCFVGHTHCPKTFVYCDGQVVFMENDEFEMDLACRYIVNVGSVGQSRDGNPMAAYGVYDTEFKTISIKRQPYNISAAQQKICEAGLPISLAERLPQGR